MTSRWVRGGAVTALILWGWVGAAAAAESGKDAEKPWFGILTFRSVGPAIGGRVARVSGVPGDPLTWWIAGTGWLKGLGGRLIISIVMRDDAINKQINVYQWGITCSPPPGAQGCTPGYWKNHLGN